MTTLGNIEKLILTTKINDKVVDSSNILDEKSKAAFKNLSKYTRDYLERESKINSYGLNSLKNELLTYWNESITPDTEKFWSEINANGINYERNEPLKFALNKKKFRQVEQGIDAKKYWPFLKTTNEIKNRFSETEIDIIDNIISADEKAKLEILKKCLRKNEIPQTQYLKFGECITYMNNCELWDNYFKKSEVTILHEIWKNFKAKELQINKNAL